MFEFPFISIILSFFLGGGIWRAAVARRMASPINDYVYIYIYRRFIVICILSILHCLTSFVNIQRGQPRSVNGAEQIDRKTTIMLGRCRHNNR